MMDWNNITGFNFTFAIPGGAWLRDSAGNVNWFTSEVIIKHKGAAWLAAQRQKQGSFTGCWIDVVPVK